MSGWSDFPWYEQIEPEVRDVVWLLRNHGINTTCSCGHEMYVEADALEGVEADKVDRVLFDAGHRSYLIEYVVEHNEVVGLRRFIRLRLFPQRDGESWRRSFGDVDAPI